MTKKDLTKAQVALLKNMMKGVPSNLSNQVLMKGDNDYIPLSGGNTVPIEMYKDFLNHFQGKSSYMWFLIYQRYFTNLWTLENATTQEKSAFKNHLVCLFWFGCGAFTTSQGKLYAWGLTPIKSDLNGDITSGYVWKNNLSLTAFQTLKPMTKIYPSDNIVYGKVGYNALPTIIHLATMIKNIDKMLQAFAANINYAGKKTKYRIKNNDSNIIRQEMEILRDVTSNLIAEIMPANETDISNTFEEIKSTTDTTLLEQIKSYIGFLQTYQGIYSNTNFKKERNISNEFKGDEIMTAIQLQDQKSELEKTVEMLNEKFNKNFKLVYSIQELEEEEELYNESDVPDTQDNAVGGDNE